MICLLLSRISKHFCAVLIGERDPTESCGHFLRYVGSAASVDDGCHIEASRNALVVNRDWIGGDANPCYVAEAHLPTRRGINSQRLKIGKTLPDSRSAPNHNVEDFLLFVQVSDDQA